MIRARVKRDPDSRRWYYICENCGEHSGRSNHWKMTFMLASMHVGSERFASRFGLPGVTVQ